jgi:rhamnogalacturonan endolyase
LGRRPLRPGARCNIAAGEEWSKVVGPIFVYVNSLDDPEPTTPAELDTLAATAGNPTIPPSWHDNANNLWQNALAQAKQENAKWPYDWVDGVDYPRKEQRGEVTGQIVLNDPLAPDPASTKLPHLTVGLTYPDSGNVIWIHDAKHYQFWNDGSEDGKFTATAPTTGSGAGTCATRCCFPTTSPTRSGRAITTRTGFSRRCPTRRTCLS